jgi:phosphonate metabolism protein (transferase hexapeptide repeat family)
MNSTFSGGLNSSALRGTLPPEQMRTPMPDQKPLLRDPKPRIHKSSLLQDVDCGAFSEISERVVLRDVKLGDFSYIERHSEAIYADIGKFCSIASNVRINALEHPMERLTTHKLTYRPNEYLFFHGVDQAFRARRQNKRVTIGNDVWIGHGAVVMPGISIGDGAVIGANAVVTKNVEPYAVHAGVPAKFLKWRFPQPIRERLQALTWWNWPLEKLAEAISDIQSMSIEAFLDVWEGA